MKVVYLKPRTMFKLFLSIFFLVFITSCMSNRVMPGVYTIEKNAVQGVQLTLNNDKSFVEYTSAAECTPKWYFGFYYTKGKRLFLNEISGYMGYLGKKDTVIYNQTSLSKVNKVYVFLNEQRPYTGANVFLDGDRYVGDIDKNGELIVPGNLKFDSIIIKTPITKPVGFKVRGQDFNQAFIVIYNYLLEECTSFNYVKQFGISSRGLFFYPDWEKNNKPRKVYLTK